MIVSVTRLHLRSWRFFPGFALHTLRSRRQAEGSAGFIGGYVAPEPLLGFWTVTVWADEGAMAAFRNTSAHLTAMRYLLHWCDEASVVHWRQDDAVLPEPMAAFERLRDTGRSSKVLHASAGHTAGLKTSRVPPGRGSLMRPK